MIKLKSYLNLWPEHYQGLQERGDSTEGKRGKGDAGLVTDSKNSLGMNACNVGEMSYTG